MEATTGIRARRARVVAAVAALLCLFAVVGPMAARSGATGHTRIHAARVVGVAAPYQQSGAWRLDQPQLAATSPVVPSADGVAVGRSVSSVPGAAALPDSPRPRGPPNGR